MTMLNEFATLKHMKYSNLVSKLVDKFKERFQDFLDSVDNMKMIDNSFTIDPFHAPDAFHFWLIDMLNDSNLSRLWSARPRYLLQAVMFHMNLSPDLVQHAQLPIDIHCTIWQHLLLQAAFSQIENWRNKILVHPHKRTIMRNSKDCHIHCRHRCRLFVH